MSGDLAFGPLQFHSCHYFAGVGGAVMMLYELFVHSFKVGSRVIFELLDQNSVRWRVKIFNKRKVIVQLVVLSLP